MKMYYDDYGIASEDLDAVVKVISERLDIPLEADSDSDFGGLYYKYRSKGNGIIKLFLNWNPLFDEWVEWRLSGHAMILEVSESPRNFEIQKALQDIKEFNIVLLERSVYDIKTKEFKRLLSAVDRRQEGG